MSLLAGVLAGCSRSQMRRPDQLPRAGQLDHGYVLMLPGVEGNPWQLRGTERALREAGIDQVIDTYGWGSYPFCELYNLRAYRTNCERARKVAERIVNYRAERPEAPITLVGYSGGAGIAILAAESLPKGVTIDRVILIGAAVSPGYDLSGVLDHARRLINFYSCRDWFVLGLGTSLFGTMDRRYTESAGRTGFLDAEGRLIETDRVVQIAWRPEWRMLGHRGGHYGWFARRWAGEVLARQIEDHRLTRGIQ